MGRINLSVEASWPRAISMSGGAQWLIDLDGTGTATTVDGLVRVRGYRRKDRPPEEVAMVEKAKAYRAEAVFFEACRHGRAAVAQAFVFVSDGPADDSEFAQLHQRLWSWGGVPLLYRKTPGLVQLFRCAHKPDFISGTGEKICKPVKTLKTAGSISTDLSKEPWWDASRLRNGTLWDDPAVCRAMLSARKAAHKSLIDAVRDLNANLNDAGILRKNLRRRLLILCLLIAYLDPKQAYNDGHVRSGAGRRRMARTVPPAVCDGYAALKFAFVVFKLHDWLGAYAGRDFHSPAS